jgi:hypothetical protein
VKSDLEIVVPKAGLIKLHTVVTSTLREQMGHTVELVLEVFLARLLEGLAILHPVRILKQHRVLPNQLCSVVLHPLGSFGLRANFKSRASG